MATADATLTLTATITNAEYRLFWIWLIAAFTAGGMVKTTETGEVDTTTVTFPVVNSTDAGFAIFRMADALQGTAPVFCKVTLGRGTGASLIRMTIEFGTGSNGTGTITGSKAVLPAFHVGQAATNAIFEGSSETHRVALILSRTVGAGGFFCFSRTLDGSNVPTNRGVVYEYKIMASSGTIINRFVNFLSSSPAEELGSSMMPPANQLTGVNSNGNVAVYPNYPMGIGEVLAPCANIAGVFVNDITVNNHQTATVAGHTGTFRILDASAMSLTVSNRRTSTQLTVMVRHD